MYLLHFRRPSLSHDKTPLFITINLNKTPKNRRQIKTTKCKQYMQGARSEVTDGTPLPYVSTNHNALSTDLVTKPRPMIMPDVANFLA